MPSSIELVEVVVVAAEVEVESRGAREQGQLITIQAMPMRTLRPPLLTRPRPRMRPPVLQAGAADSRTEIEIVCMMQVHIYYMYIFVNYVYIMHIVINSDLYT